MSNEVLNALKKNSSDQLAWTSLYREMRPWVFSNCVRWLGNLEDAEDVTQKTFMHLAVNWNRFDFPDWPRLCEYLKRSSTSRSWDLLRQRKRAANQLAPKQPAVDALPGPPDAFYPTTLEQLVQHLDLSPQELAAFSERERKLLWLSYLGYSSAEIARQTGVSERTVRRDMLALRRLLR